MPATTAEVMARAQLLLNFLPAADKMDKWRDTIQSLINFVEASKSQQAELLQRPRMATAAQADGRVEGAAPMVQSPPRQQAQRQPQQASHANDRDEASIVSSGPHDRQDQRRVLEDRRKEYTRITIERCREAHHQSDKCNGPDISDPTPSVGGYLPYEVGCPAFTSELRRVRWPSTRAFKPELTEKYDGKLNPAEFLGIYTIAVQAAGGRDGKVLANYFPLALKPNVRS